MKFDRYTKAVLTVIALALVWLCARGTPPVASAAATAAAVPKVVRAQRFEVVDKEGKVCASMGWEGGEVDSLLGSAGPAIRIMDKNGKVRAGMSLGKDGRPELSFRDRLEEERLTLFVSESVTLFDDGYVGVHLWDGTTKAARLMLRLSNDNGPSVWMRDKDGNLRTILGTANLETTKTGATTKTAESSLVLFDKEGKVLWKAPQE